MPRLPYAIPSNDVAASISNRRGGQLTPLDLLLSHNDALASGWNSLLGAVRNEFSFPGDLREMAILRIGHLNHARYEWDAHLPVARAEGLPDEVIATLEQESPHTGHEIHDALLGYIDEMTLDVVVTQETFEQLRLHFSDVAIAELTAIVASYNMVSRFLVALDVQTADRELVTAITGARNA
ncbi:carboxymuconolactone decarboxylase family protein [Arthrobacter sp.]|uniref:carboxymuconolactone decarboxylase family protein n=1 Tax=Arthrobacter sp. TaxID=1667 RepID=UPI003A94F6E2